MESDQIIAAVMRLLKLLSDSDRKKAFETIGEEWCVRCCEKVDNCDCVWDYDSAYEYDED